VCNKSVKLVHGILIFVTHAGKANANTEWNAPEILKSNYYNFIIKTNGKTEYDHQKMQFDTRTSVSEEILTPIRLFEGYFALTTPITIKRLVYYIN
jgi:hypothetical protein